MCSSRSDSKAGPDQVCSEGRRIEAHLFPTLGPEGWSGILRIVGLFILAGLVLLPRPAVAQTTDPPNSVPLNQSRWAVGLQAMPVPGFSVRHALTSRIAVQVAGIPEVGPFRGGLGGRLLYRIDVQEKSSLFASGAYSLLLEKYFAPTVDFVSPDPDDTARLHYGAATLGFEGALGGGLSLTVELGGAYVGREKEENFLFPGFGIGVHVRWD